MSRTGNTSWLRRPLSLVQPWLLWVFRAKRNSEYCVAGCSWSQQESARKKSCAHSAASTRMQNLSAEKASHMKSKTIKVDYLARVEGEGAFPSEFENICKWGASEGSSSPQDFFEDFFRGRNSCEVPDITARICGICPGRISDERVSCHRKYLRRWCRASSDRCADSCIAESGSKAMFFTYTCCTRPISSATRMPSDGQGPREAGKGCA